MTEKTEIAVQPDAPGSVLNIIARAAADPATDVVKLQALLDLQRQVMADQAKVEFTRALHLAQGEIPAIEKDGIIKLVNKDGIDKGSIPFVTYEQMSRFLKPIMDRHGLTIDFDMTAKEGGGAIISATLTHIAGHSKTISIPLALDSGPGRNNLQAMGSTLSYGRRYCCEMMFNIVRKGVDDDGVLGGSNTLMPEEIAAIERLIKEVGADRGKFMTFMKVDRLEDIPHKQYVTAINALEVKRSKK